MRDDNKFVNNKDFGYLGKVGQESRGAGSKIQVGNQNQIESTRINKSYPDKITAAQAKPNSGSKKNEATGPRQDQRAGGSKNVSVKEQAKFALKAKPKGR